jgi:hypothetical protein
MFVTSLFFEPYRMDPLLPCVGIFNADNRDKVKSAGMSDPVSKHVADGRITLD